jgi:sugar (pentulose or hexulose) kinase
MNIAVINLGLKSVRCIVFNEEGEKLASFSEPLRTFIQEDLVEQDPNEWWQKTKSVVGKALQSTEVREQVKLLAVTASASCLVCIDERGLPLMNAIMVSDARSRKHAELLENTHEFQKVKADTGIRATADLMLPKIMWLKDNKRDVYDSTYKFLSPNDFLIFKLTGEFVTDINNAIKYHFDIHSKGWPTKLLNTLGIDESKLPLVTEQGSIISMVSKSVAEKLCLPRDTKLILTTYDALCAVFGSGVSEVGDGCDVSGTVTSLRVVTDKHIVDPQKRVFFSPYYGSSYWLAGGSNNMGGGIIEWAKQLLFEGNEGAYDVMEEVIAESRPCSEGLIFLPYLLGERTPVWDPLAKGVFFGLGRHHTQTHMIRAIFESAGFSVLHIAETLKDLGVETKIVSASGGLSRINSICQIKADMLNVPVELVNEFETTSLGAAILAGVGTGYFSSLKEASNTLVRKGRRFEPNKDKNEVYMEYFELYKNLYANLKDLFQVRERLRLKYREGGRISVSENL